MQKFCRGGLLSFREASRTGSAVSGAFLSPEWAKNWQTPCRYCILGLWSPTAGSYCTHQAAGLGFCMAWSHVVIHLLAGYLLPPLSELSFCQHWHHLFFWNMLNRARIYMYIKRKDMFTATAVPAATSNSKHMRLKKKNPQQKTTTTPKPRKLTYIWHFCLKGLWLKFYKFISKWRILYLTAKEIRILAHAGDCRLPQKVQLHF